jgi:alkanesulfonate monooxygenase SsuD/methylene tetrahydromethanopterin reductase-like flavin-dependent oxidoreductase (luciferase family)
MAIQKELHTEEVRGRAKPAINLQDSVADIRDNEELIIETNPMDMAYIDELAFMEEKITIRLEPSADRYSPKFVDVAVNGRIEWLEVGTPIKVARKYVEVLARAKSDTFITIAPNTNDENPVNMISRNTSQKYPFSVIKDPNPRGYQWLTTVLSQ